MGNGMTVWRVMERLSSPDHRLMRRVHRWQPPRWVRSWMIAATRAGDGWLWLGLGVFLLASGDPSRYPAAAAAALAAMFGVLVFLFLKQVVGRRRPCDIEPHCWARLLPPDQFSFPSGHTITAFAVAVSLSVFYPSLAIGLIVSAAIIAVSRIMLGMHFFSDVVAGCALGCLLGYLAVWIVTGPSGS